MGYPPEPDASRIAPHTYRESYRKRGKSGRRNLGALEGGEKRVLNEREITEVTLKRLHTLGRQKFGSSPFSHHFDRWLVNIRSVISEFEAHPTIGVDDLFVEESSQTLSTIKHQLDERRRRETTIDQEIKYLSDCRNQLQQINAEYIAAVKAARSRKNSELKRLNPEISRLKKEQDAVIRLKTGFFRGISRKERERRELVVISQLNEKQTALELLVLSFNIEIKKLQEDFETTREPVVEQIKLFRKVVREAETDGSLEERWFACEALIDAVNTFLQRKAAKPARA